MFGTEMKTRFTYHLASRQSFCILLILIVLIVRIECLPRQYPDRDFKKRSLHVNFNHHDHSDEQLLPKNKFTSKVSDFREDKSKRDRNPKMIPPITLESRSKYGDSGWEIENHGVDSNLQTSFGNRDGYEGRSRRTLDSSVYRGKESISNPHDSPLKNLHDEETDDDAEDVDTTDEPRIDVILNDMNSQKEKGSDTIMEYYYVSETDEFHHYGVPKHGVIINLRGLIPSPINAESDSLRGGISRDADEVLAFKAFEISSSPLSVDPGRWLSEFDDQFTEEAVDVKDHKTSFNTTLLESRNLSRKRRQKASPGQEEDRHRRGYFRRRRRKRKRRLRTKIGDVSDGEGRFSPQEKFLLKSNGPAYVITSANEVKKDWCRTVPLKQKIVEANCRSRVIMNNFCYGQCNSFFIPHSGKSDSGAAFQSCAFCKPHKSKWTTVSLHCPGQTPSRVDKKILIVDSCRCKTEILQ